MMAYNGFLRQVTANIAESNADVSQRSSALLPARIKQPSALTAFYILLKSVPNRGINCILYEVEEFG